VYRICEISNLAADFVKPYKINNKTVNQGFELKHGKSIKTFLMDKVSNSTFHPKEFDRLVKVHAAEDVKLPSKRHLEKKVAQLAKLSTQPMTESDISAMLARKNMLQSTKHSAGWLTMEKSRLTQARTLAIRRQDYDEVKDIDAKLEALALSTATSTERTRDDGSADMLAKVNERNRKANLEAVRKAEIMEAERKRRERKLAASGTATQQDPSARLKILPRLFNAATTSRSGTPLPAGTHGETRSTSPVPSSLGSSDKAPTFESTVIDSIEVDLGDF
jgi:RNA polymerase-associated protein RTF1